MRPWLTILDTPAIKEDFLAYLREEKDSIVLELAGSTVDQRRLGALQQLIKMESYVKNSLSAKSTEDSNHLIHAMLNLSSKEET